MFRFFSHCLSVFRFVFCFFTIIVFKSLVVPWRERSVESRAKKSFNRHPVLRVTHVEFCIMSSEANNCPSRIMSDSSVENDEKEQIQENQAAPRKFRKRGGKNRPSRGRFRARNFIHIARMMTSTLQNMYRRPPARYSYSGPPTVLYPFGPPNLPVNESLGPAFEPKLNDGGQEVNKSVKFLNRFTFIAQLRRSFEAFGAFLTRTHSPTKFT